MYIVFFAVSFFACIIGRICGMGGGVIIKPVLDSLGIMSVATINFLSGCTVLGMTFWSIGKGAIKKESQVDLKTSTPLAAGAAVGGIMGKACFSAAERLFADPDTAGGIQAFLLLLATFATFLYTLRKDRIRSMHVSHPVLIILIGLALGMLGSFLGIGGGPFNMAVLFLFFSMPTKTAAQNSLYIILISQLASLLLQLFTGNVPPVIPAVLTGMILAGILGSETGSMINKRLNDKRTTVLFEGAMILVMLICLYNIKRFTSP